MLFKIIFTKVEISKFLVTKKCFYLQIINNTFIEEMTMAASRRRASLVAAAQATEGNDTLVDNYRANNISLCTSLAVPIVDYTTSSSSSIIQPTSLVSIPETPFTKTSYMKNSRKISQLMKKVSLSSINHYLAQQQPQLQQQNQVQQQQQFKFRRKAVITLDARTSEVFL